MTRSPRLNLGDFSDGVVPKSSSRGNNGVEVRISGSHVVVLVIYLKSYIIIMDI